MVIMEIMSGRIQTVGKDAGAFYNRQIKFAGHLACIIPTARSVMPL